MLFLKMSSRKMGSKFQPFQPSLKLYVAVVAVLFLCGDVASGIQKSDPLSNSVKGDILRNLDKPNATSYNSRNKPASFDPNSDDGSVSYSFEETESLDPEPIGRLKIPQVDPQQKIGGTEQKMIRDDARRVATAPPKIVLGNRALIGHAPLQLYEEPQTEPLPTAAKKTSNELGNSREYRSVPVSGPGPTNTKPSEKRNQIAYDYYDDDDTETKGLLGKKESGKAPGVAKIRTTQAPSDSIPVNKFRSGTTAALSKKDVTLATTVGTVPSLHLPLLITRHALEEAKIPHALPHKHSRIGIVPKLVLGGDEKIGAELLPNLRRDHTRRKRPTKRKNKKKKMNAKGSHMGINGTNHLSSEVSHAGNSSSGSNHDKHDAVGDNSKHHESYEYDDHDNEHEDGTTNNHKATPPAVQVTTKHVTQSTAVPIPIRITTIAQRKVTKSNDLGIPNLQQAGAGNRVLAGADPSNYEYYDDADKPNSEKSSKTVTSSPVKIEKALQPKLTSSAPDPKYILPIPGQILISKKDHDTVPSNQKQTTTSVPKTVTPADLQASPTSTHKKINPNNSSPVLMVKQNSSLKSNQSLDDVEYYDDGLTTKSKPRVETTPLRKTTSVLASAPPPAALPSAAVPQSKNAPKVVPTVQQAISTGKPRRISKGNAALNDPLGDIEYYDDTLTTAKIQLQPINKTDRINADEHPTTSKTTKSTSNPVMPAEILPTSSAPQVVIAQSAPTVKPQRNPKRNLSLTPNQSPSDGEYYDDITSTKPSLSQQNLYTNSIHLDSNVLNKSIAAPLLVKNASIETSILAPLPNLQPEASTLKPDVATTAPIYVTTAVPLALAASTIQQNVEISAVKHDSSLPPKVAASSPQLVLTIAEPVYTLKPQLLQSVPVQVSSQALDVPLSNQQPVTTVRPNEMPSASMQISSLNSKLAPSSPLPAVPRKTQEAPTAPTYSAPNNSALLILQPVVTENPHDLASVPARISSSAPNHAPSRSQPDATIPPLVAPPLPISDSSVQKNHPLTLTSPQPVFIVNPQKDSTAPIQHSSVELKIVPPSLQPVVNQPTMKLHVSPSPAVEVFGSVTNVQALGSTAKPREMPSEALRLTSRVPETTEPLLNISTKPISIAASPAPVQVSVIMPQLSTPIPEKSPVKKQRILKQNRGLGQALDDVEYYDELLPTTRKGIQYEPETNRTDRALSSISNSTAVSPKPTVHDINTVKTSSDNILALPKSTPLVKTKRISRTNSSNLNKSLDNMEYYDEIVITTPKPLEQKIVISPGDSKQTNYPESTTSALKLVTSAPAQIGTLLPTVLPSSSNPLTNSKIGRNAKNNRTSNLNQSLNDVEYYDDFISTKKPIPLQEQLFTSQPQSNHIHTSTVPVRNTTKLPFTDSDYYDDTESPVPNNLKSHRSLGDNTNFDNMTNYGRDQSEIDPSQNISKKNRRRRTRKPEPKNASSMPNVPIILNKNSASGNTVRTVTEPNLISRKYASSQSMDQNQAPAVTPTLDHTSHNTTKMKRRRRTTQPPVLKSPSIFNAPILSLENSTPTPVQENLIRARSAHSISMQNSAKVAPTAIPIISPENKPFSYHTPIYVENQEQTKTKIELNASGHSAPNPTKSKKRRRTTVPVTMSTSPPRIAPIIVQENSKSATLQTAIEENSIPARYTASQNMFQSPNSEHSTQNVTKTKKRRRTTKAAMLITSAPLVAPLSVKENSTPRTPETAIEGANIPNTRHPALLDAQQIPAISLSAIPSIIPKTVTASLSLASNIANKDEKLSSPANELSLNKIIQLTSLPPVVKEIPTVATVSTQNLPLPSAPAHLIPKQKVVTSTPSIALFNQPEANLPLPSADTSTRQLKKKQSGMVQRHMGDLLAPEYEYFDEIEIVKPVSTGNSNLKHTEKISEKSSDSFKSQGRNNTDNVALPSQSSKSSGGNVNSPSDTKAAPIVHKSAAAGIINISVSSKAADSHRNVSVIIGPIAIPNLAPAPSSEKTVPTQEPSLLPIEPVLPAPQSNVALIENVPQAPHTDVAPIKTALPASQSAVAPTENVPQAPQTDVAPIKSVPNASQSDVAPIKTVPSASQSAVVPLEMVPPAPQSDVAPIESIQPAPQSDVAPIESILPAPQLVVVPIVTVLPALLSTPTPIEIVPQAPQSTAARVKIVPSELQSAAVQVKIAPPSTSPQPIEAPIKKDKLEAPQITATPIEIIPQAPQRAVTQMELVHSTPQQNLPSIYNLNHQTEKTLETIKSTPQPQPMQLHNKNSVQQIQYIPPPVEIIPQVPYNPFPFVNVVPVPQPPAVSQIEGNPAPVLQLLNPYSANQNAPPILVEQKLNPFMLQFNNSQIQKANQTLFVFPKSTMVDLRAVSQNAFQQIFNGAYTLWETLMSAVLSRPSPNI